MARINTNVPSVIAQSNLGRANGELDLRLERLSTGLRINRGRDDPAGLIISERIGTDLAGIEQGIRNGERASSVIATAEAALQEVNDLLNSIKGLLVEAANSGANSAEERAANQLQIDSAIDSITRISSTATFGGLNLLDGSLDYITSGVAGQDITQASILGASLSEVDSLQVEVDVVTSAQQGALYLSGDNPGANPDGVVLSTSTLRIQGNRGTQQLTFPSGTALTDVVNAVNNITTQTGVTAELINGDPNSGVVFKSEGFGLDSFVEVERVNGPVDPSIDNIQLFALADDAQNDTPFDFAGLTAAGQLNPSIRDSGRDVVALINGNLATSSGLEVALNTPTLSVELELTESFATDPTLATTSFDIIGGGATFQLGPNITLAQQAFIGIQSVSASEIGGTVVDGTLQFLESLQSGEVNSIENSVRSSDFSAAQAILENSIDEIAVLRGRLGAFERNVLEPNGRNLQAAFENLSASRSLIRDADFAFETSQLTRAQILQSSSTQVLGIANQSAQSVLQLLG